MPLLSVLMNMNQRGALAGVVIEMLKAANPEVTDDEVYDLLEAYREKDPKMDELSKVVMEELLAALGNSPAEIKRTLKIASLERQKMQRAADATLMKRLAELEETDPPDGAGKRSKDSASEPSDSPPESSGD